MGYIIKKSPARDTRETRKRKKHNMSPLLLPLSSAPRSGLDSLAQIGELARRLEFMPREHPAGSGRTVSGLAHLVERLTAEREAAGSIPCAGPIFKV